MSDTTRVYNEYDIAKGATADLTGSDLRNGGYRGVVVFLDINAIAGTSPSVTVTIQGRSPTGQYYDILVGAAETSTGLGEPLRVYPGISETANVSADDLLPPRWRVTVDVDTVDGNETYDYDVAFAYIP